MKNAGENNEDIDVWLNDLTLPQEYPRGPFLPLAEHPGTP